MVSCSVPDVVVPSNLTWSSSQSGERSGGEYLLAAQYLPEVPTTWQQTVIQLTASFIALEALQPEAKQKRKKWCNYVYFTAYVFAANFSVQDKEQAFMCLLQFWEMRNEYKSFSFCCLASNATAAKEFCEEHECPASWKDANRENCCVYHANIHSCPLAFMVSIMVQHRVLCSCY